VVHRRFDAGAVNSAIDREGVTLISVVETMLRRILEDRKDRPFPVTLRAAVVGGGPVAADLLARCPQAIATYGLTETCSMVTLASLETPPRARSGAGRPLPGIEIEIIDEAGRSVTSGETGLIAVRGPVVMRGYLGAAPLREGDWFVTGDLGRFDGEGNLHVAGRREEMIVSGGENVYPAEIEEALLQHPGVSEAVVTGIPDQEWGEAPIALVVPREAGLSADDLIAFLQSRLARYKIPRIRFGGEIPRLANGKPDRAAIISRHRG
jgi:O-succinylbenzoic acid--CoA ligase